MLLIFVKRMYSYAWCSVNGVKVARFSGMSEVSGYSHLLSACTVKRGAPVHGLVPYSFLTLIGRAPPELHLRSYNIVHLCVLILG